MERLEVEYSPAQRLALYEAVLEKFRAKREGDRMELGLDLDLSLDSEKKGGEDNKPKSHIEVIAEMRDYRRRRQSYRAKNVHITKKSKTDVMREIIEAHMKFLEDTSKPQRDDEEDFQQNRGNARPDKDRAQSREFSERRPRSRSRERGRSKGARSRSGSRSRDGREGRHGSHHSSKHKHKHKSKHRSRDEEM